MTYGFKKVRKPPLHVLTRQIADLTEGVKVRHDRIVVLSKELERLVGHCLFDRCLDWDSGERRGS